MGHQTSQENQGIQGHVVPAALDAAETPDLSARQASLDARGMMAVALAEGAYLGLVSDITVDAKERRIAAICVRPGTGKDAIHTIPWKDITRVGRNVVLVESERAARSSEEEAAAPSGTPANSLRGRVIATDAGAVVGRLGDLAVESATGRVVGLLFSGGRRLALRSPEEVVFGPDQIVLTAAAAERIEDASVDDEPGFLDHLRTANPIEELRSTFKDLFVRSSKDDGAASATAEGSDAGSKQEDV